MTGGATRLAIRREDTAEVCLLHLDGPVDRLTSDALRAELNALAASGPKTTQVSFAGVPILDSSGIGILITAKKSFAANGRYLILRDLSPRIAEVLKLLRLYDLLVVDL